MPSPSVDRRYSCRVAAGSRRAADPVADFYRGQTITLLVGASTGGGYDAYARPVSRHLGRFIPGEPNIVVQVHGRRPASLPAANTLYTVSPKDGLTIGVVQRHIPFEMLRGNKKHRPTTRSSSPGSAASIPR